MRRPTVLKRVDRRLRHDPLPFGQVAQLGEVVPASVAQPRTDLGDAEMHLGAAAEVAGAVNEERRPLEVRVESAWIVGQGGQTSPVAHCAPQRAIVVGGEDERRQRLAGASEGEKRCQIDVRADL